MMKHGSKKGGGKKTMPATKNSAASGAPPAPSGSKAKPAC